MWVNNWRLWGGNATCGDTVHREYYKYCTQIEENDEWVFRELLTYESRPQGLGALDVGKTLLREMVQWEMSSEVAWKEFV
jgi:hypothetical protein